MAGGPCLRIQRDPGRSAYRASRERSMSRRSGRVEIGCAACVVAVLALLLVRAPDASASSPPSWQVVSAHVPAEIPLAEAVDQEDTVTIASSAAGEAPYVG